MKARRLLLLPLLSPLLAVLLVAALNPRPQVSFRLLTWATPRAPLGLWLAAAALGGAALSGAGTALALHQGAGVPNRRRVARRAPEPWSQAGPGDGGWDGVATHPGPGAGRRMEPPAPGVRVPGWPRGGESWPDGPAVVAPTRPPGEPAPTVDAPFRILRRPTAAPRWETVAATGDREATARGRQAEAVPAASADDWGSGASGEDW